MVKYVTLLIRSKLNLLQSGTSTESFQQLKDKNAVQNFLPKDNFSPDPLRKVSYKLCRR